MKLRIGLLALIAFLPVLLEIAGAESKMLGVILVSIPVSLLIGAATSLILRRRGAIWWAMIITFLFQYFAAGLIWNQFDTLGFWGRDIINTASMLAIAAFIAALFTYGLVIVFKKQIALMRDQQAGKAPVKKATKR